MGKNVFFFGLNVQMDFTRIEKKVHENISSVFKIMQINYLYKEDTELVLLVIPNCRLD